MTLRAFVLAVVLAGTARADTASVVANLKSEETECSFLLGLCRTANRTARFAADTPVAGATDGIATRNARRAEMSVQDAIEAGRAIRAKHGGRKLACFDDPECGFVRAKVFP